MIKKDWLKIGNCYQQEDKNCNKMGEYLFLEVYLRHSYENNLLISSNDGALGRILMICCQWVVTQKQGLSDYPEYASVAQLPSEPPQVH